MKKELICVAKFLGIYAQTDLKIVDQTQLYLERQGRDDIRESSSYSQSSTDNSISEPEIKKAASTKSQKKVSSADKTD